MTTISQSSDRPRLIVTGATGFVGSKLVAIAKSKSIDVLPVIRSEEKGARLGLEKWILFSELTNSKLVEAGFESSVVVHLIGSSRDEEDCSLRESIVKTTETVITLAKEAGIKRLIYLSGFGTTLNSSEIYFRSKAEAENLIKASGIPYIIFRSSYILGLGDELTPYLIDQLKKGEVEIPGDGSYRFQPIFIEDLAEVIINAVRLEVDESYSYDLLGPEITFLEYVNLLSSRCAPKATIKLEKLETFIRRAIFSADPIFTTGELSVLICDLIGPVTESYLGVRIRGVEEVLDTWINQANPINTG
jgi:uncharacterized protein YbjT (DUF2867 family)